MIKSHLNRNETKKVSFKLTPEDLYIYNEDIKSYQVPEGEFIAKIGGSSDRLVLASAFNLASADLKPDLSLVNIRTMPTFPKEGEKIVFMASLLNNGTKSTKSGEKSFNSFLCK